MPGVLEPNWETQWRLWFPSWGAGRGRAVVLEAKDRLSSRAPPPCLDVAVWRACVRAHARVFQPQCLPSSRRGFPRTPQSTTKEVLPTAKLNVPCCAPRPSV